MAETHVLLVCANPRGTDPLRLNEEERTLKEAIRLSQYRDRLKVTVLNAATIDDLRRELLRDRFDIVHFSGHGTRAGLVFEDTDGRLMVPDSAALAELLARRGITTAVLNACYSLTAGSIGSLALDYTVAMEGPIADKSAIEFSRGFYDALGAGLDVSDAYAEGLSCCRLKHLSLSAVLVRKGVVTSTAAVVDSPDQKTRNIETSDEVARRLLLGVAIDTSGSMSSSIRNNDRGNLSRLSSVKEGLARLARSIRRELSSRTAETQPLDSVKVFVYAFGLRHADTADLLSVARATDAIDIRAEVERRKRIHEAEARRRYSGLSGFGAFARTIGYGSVVDDLERSARAGAEANIREQIAREVAGLLLQKTHDIGDTTYSPAEVADLFERPGDKDVIVEVEPLIYGGTPMVAVARELRGRFDRHPARDDEARILLIVSDGDPTDGDPGPEFEALKARGVTVIACYVTDGDVSNPRMLLGKPETAWPPGARRMYDTASTIDEDGPFAKHLLRKGWCIEPGAHLFVQVNHSDVLEEFLQVAGSPMSRYSGAAIPEGR